MGWATSLASAIKSRGVFLAVLGNAPLVSSSGGTQNYFKVQVSNSIGTRVADGRFRLIPRCARWRQLHRHRVALV
jgi:hypothetical protein